MVSTWKSGPKDDFMSTFSVPIAWESGSIRRLWWIAIVVLAVGAIAFGIFFHAEVTSAITVWNESTAYNHCFLILPISAYLIWERRHVLAARAPHPNPWVIAAMLPVGLVWQFAASAQIMEGRQLAAMTLFELFVLATVGFQVWRVSAFALLYLYFWCLAARF